MDFPAPEILIARGKYATLRSEHRQHSTALQTAMVAFFDQGRLLLKSVEDSANLAPTLEAMARRWAEISNHSAELITLQATLDVLKPDAWPSRSAPVAASRAA